MSPSVPAVHIEIDHCGSQNRNAFHVSKLSLETLRERDVVRIEPRDVPPLRALETAVERRREPELLVVPQDEETWIVGPRKPRGRLVGRGVVDDDELEVRNGLSQHTLDRRRDEAVVVVHGEQHGNERHAASVRP